MVFDCYVMNIIIFGADRQMNKIDPVTESPRTKTPKSIPEVTFLSTVISYGGGGRLQ